MSFYSLDRLRGFGLMMKSEGSMLAAQQAPEQQAMLYTKGDRDLSQRMTIMNLGPLIATAVAAPAKTEQQKAEEELAALEKAAHEAETAAVVEEVLDLGEPEKTPWLLYGGIGLGALVLVGGALFLTKKKGAKKVAGYKRRRRRR